MKNVTVLLHDYWHTENSVAPVLDKLLPCDNWSVKVTREPQKVFESEMPDLLISFKDVIENDQIPTPLWCNENWTGCLDDNIKNRGMGFMAVHCGIADIPKEHFISQNILRAYFISHPEQCEVSFEPTAQNEITNGIEKFVFEKPDEHYQIEILGDTSVLGYTVSKHGRQPALWCHNYGKGRVLAVTPGHSYENLSNSVYLRLLKNCCEWCCREV